MDITEGYVDFDGYQTYYRIVGHNAIGRVPLLVLHGGPGMAHFYLESLDEIAQYGRQVIYYDQSGCGNSPTPDRSDVWSAEFFERELVAVREQLGLDEIHLLGQSWGGMLAMQYLTHRPAGVRSAVIASSPASTDLWVQEALRLRSYLAPDMQAALVQADEDGDYERADVQRAVNEYYRLHVCKLDPYPSFIQKTFDQMGPVYMTMQGASEFVMTGKLKGWDITSDLGRIVVPTLVTSGTIDECTPLVAKKVVDAIPGAHWTLFDGGTHFLHAECPEEYNATVEDFIEHFE